MYYIIAEDIDDRKYWWGEFTEDEAVHEADKLWADGRFFKIKILKVVLD